MKLMNIQGIQGIKGTKGIRSKNWLLSMVLAILLCPFAEVYANGEFYDQADMQTGMRRFSGVKKHPHQNNKSKSKHHATRKRNHYPNYSYSPCYMDDDCGTCCANPCKPIKKKHHKKPVKEVEVGVIERAPKCDIVYEFCEPFPPLRVSCEIINPADIVDSNCTQFIHKLRICEAAACQAPYSQDPTIKTKWQIHGKNGDRCIISSTTEDIGIKDSNGKPIPVTQMCEYDKRGVKGLIERFRDQTERYYHTSTCDRFEGIHNCTVNTRGQTIKEAVKEPQKEINVPPPTNG